MRFFVFLDIIKTKAKVNFMNKENVRPTITEFKTRFAKTFRFSPYPIYDPEQTYAKDDEVLWLSEMFQWGVYKAKAETEGNDPSDTELWEKQDVNLNSFVMDSDIEEAMGEAAAYFPEHANMVHEEYVTCFLLLTTHFLIKDWQATHQGLNASGASGILTSRTVGKMSAGYAVSTLLQMYPQWQALVDTWWGLKAVTLMSRYCVGNIIGVPGAFTPY